MMNTPKPDYGADLLGQVHVAVIRLDAKVDALKDQIKEMRDLYNDHEKRLRLIEAEPKIDPARVKALEDRDYVSPATVWKVVSLICTLAGIGLSILVATR